jgi:glutaredoxin
MLVQDGCGACAAAKELLKDSIESKKIVLVDATSEKGIELADRHKIETVPTIINEKGDFQQKCFISKDGEKMFCDDGSEKVILY